MDEDCQHRRIRCCGEIALQRHLKPWAGPLAIAYMLALRGANVKLIADLNYTANAWVCWL